MSKTKTANIIIKPKLWRYKSGSKKGKLRPQAKAYLSFKIREYYVSKKHLVKKLDKTHKYERFSLAYIDDKYGITLRAEIVAPIDKPEIVQTRLDRFLSSVANSNAGFKKLDFKPQKIAKERELIDYKEAQASGTLNTMTWSVDK